MSKKTKQSIKKSSLLSIAFSLSVVMVIAVASFLNISLFPPKVSLQEIQEVKAAGESWYATDGTWNYRKKITIDRTKVADVTDPSTTYANFPLLVSTTGLSNIKANGVDIRFTMADGITEIPREIESYDSGNLEAWVKLTLTKDDGDAIDDNDVIYMYYGNADANEPAINSEFGRNNVWDSNFKMVQHMNESPANDVAEHLDSTSNRNNATPKNFDNDVTSTTNGIGQIDGADVFDGVDDYVNITDDTSLDNIWDGGGTLSFWFYPKSAGEADAGYWVTKLGNWTLFSYTFHIAGQTGYQFTCEWSGGTAKWRATSTTPPISFNEWHHITLTYNTDSDSNIPVLYVDNVGFNTTQVVAPSGMRNVDANHDVQIGGNLSMSRASDGTIDEVRISDTIRSVEWIATEFNNQSDIADFLTFGVETSLSCTYAGGVCRDNACHTYPNCSLIIGACNTGNCCSGICTIDTEDPTTPTNLTATAISSSQINLTWTASTDNVGVTGYRIYKNSVAIDTTAGTTYSNTGLNYSTEYTYTILAYDIMSNESSQSTSANATTETPDTTAPTDISNLAVSSCIYNSCNLTWTAPGDDNNSETATSYNIRYSTGVITAENWNSATQVANESSPKIAGTTETHTVTGLASETIYYFAIKTADEVPNESGLSNSNVSGETTVVVYRYIRTGATGNNDGSDWENAYSSFASAVWVRGYVYYVAGGTYNENPYIRKSPSGNTWIIIKKANDIENSGDLGWNPTYATNQAVITGRVAMSGGYIEIDGVTGSLNSGHGIKILQMTERLVLEFGYDSFYHLHHIELEGSGFTANHDTDGIYGINFSTPRIATKGLHISYCYIHNLSRQGVTLGGQVGTSFSDYGVLYENNFMEEIGGTQVPGSHAQGIMLGQYTTQSYSIIRNSIFKNIVGSGCIDTLGCSGTTCSDTSHINIYNNIFMSTDTETYWVSPGVIWTHPGTIATDIKIYNNTFYNMNLNQIVNDSGTVAGSEVKNNLFHSGTFTANPRGVTSQYNSYYNCDGFGVPSGEVGQQNETTDPVINSAGYDFRLRDTAKSKDNGINLSSIFSTDILGTVRPQGAGWDIGAYEYTQLSNCGNGVCDGTENCLNCSIDCGACPADTTAPARSSASPSGTLTSGTTQINISLTTNESATCKYSTTPNTAYASMTNTFTTTGGISHSQTITGLTDGSTYNYYVRCVDTSDNVNTNDYEINFSIATVGPDTTPPTATISINNGSSKTNSQTTSLSISAADPSTVTEMKISNTNNFSTAATIAYTTIKEWILTSTDGLKTVYAWFKDSVGNWNTTPKTDTIILDETPPIISNITTSNITTNSATINFTTNENTTSYIEYGLTTSYGSQTETNATGIMNYELGIMGLSANTTYNFKITSTDEAGNTSSSINQTFITDGTPDTTPPANITSLTATNITQTSASLNWTSPGDDNNTGTASSYDLKYSTSNITNDTDFNNATPLSGEPIPQTAGTNQSLYIAVGLSPNTTYYFAIKTSDEVPNISNLSNILSITTLAESTPPPSGGGGGGGGSYSDTTPPSIPDDFTAMPAESQITLTWNNPANTDFVRVKVLRREGSAPISHNDETATIIYEGTNQEYTDINLDNNKTYHYAIFAYDQKPNYSEVLAISSQPIEGKTTIEIPNEEPTYPNGTLLKTIESFKVYIIIDNKKKWIPTPEVFETLGYQWGEITIISKTNLNKIPNYEDNLIRAINDYKVYLVVNGISRHLPNPEIFLDYGFSWDDVIDVPQATINQYQRAYLIRESRQGKIYYLREDKIKKHIPNAEVFASYNNNWEDVQVISKKEMEAYVESWLIQLEGDNGIYLIENGTKRYISSVEIFNRNGFEWEKVVEVNEVEFNLYEIGDVL